jgi:serine/threonine protein kinase
LDSTRDKILRSIQKPSSTPAEEKSLDFEVNQNPTRPTNQLGFNAITQAQQFPYLQPPLFPDEIGRLAHFRVLALVGQGGMGCVFQAEDTMLARPVALKVLKPSISTLEWRQRFVMEARLLARLRHEHLVTVFQIGQDQEVCYLVMELLQGESLESRLQRIGKIPLPLFHRLAREILSGLQAVHATGLIHRDLKPSNIFLESPADKVKLIDFGLARVIDDDAHLTQTGFIVGTPAFMSPEQAEAEPLDHRSDLFSVGTVLYFMATGQLPFQGAKTTALLLSLVTTIPPAVRELNPDFPPELSDLIMQLLAKDLDDRPSSATEVLGMFESIESGKPKSRPKQKKAPQPVVEPISNSTWATMVDVADSHLAPTEMYKKKKAIPYQMIGIIAAGLLVMGLIVYAIFPRPKAVQPTESAEVASKTPTKQTPATQPAATPQQVYLTVLTPVEALNYPFNPPPDKKDLPNIFKVISVGGVVSPHGLGTHPVREGPVRLTYSLSGQYREFRGEVGLNDSSKGSFTPMNFLIFGDGEILWRSKPVTGHEDRQPFNVSVKGVKSLTIEVGANGAVGGAHGVWIEPVLVK